MKKRLVVMKLIEQESREHGLASRSSVSIKSGALNIEPGEFQSILDYLIGRGFVVKKGFGFNLTEEGKEYINLLTS